MLPPASPPPISSPSPLPTSSIPFKPLTCEGNPIDFGSGRAAIYFVCHSKDGKIYTGQIPLGEVRR